VILILVLYFFQNDRDVHGISTRRDRIVAAIMLILAVVTSTIAIFTNIFNLFGNKS
jgi:hypothetical protein